MPEKVVNVVGKKKSATARAKLTKGKGRVHVNAVPLEQWGSYLARTMLMEPLRIAEDVTKDVDIDVNVSGGGPMGQAAASRTAISRGIYEWSKDEKVRKALLAYDDKMLSGDSRRKEPCKPGDSAPRARRQKSYR